MICCECQKEVGEIIKKRCYNCYARHRRKVRIEKDPIKTKAASIAKTIRAKYGADEYLSDADYIFNIIKDIKHCECCGCELSFKASSYKKLSRISADRLDSSRCYTRDNVRFICFRCNRLKGNSTIDQLEGILKYMHERILN